MAKYNIQGVLQQNDLSNKITFCYNQYFNHFNTYKLVQQVQVSIYFFF